MKRYANRQKGAKWLDLHHKRNYGTVTRLKVATTKPGKWEPVSCNNSLWKDFSPPSSWPMETFRQPLLPREVIKRNHSTSSSLFTIHFNFSTRMYLQWKRSIIEKRHMLYAQCSTIATEKKEKRELSIISIDKKEAHKRKLYMGFWNCVFNA